MGVTRRELMQVAGGAGLLAALPASVPGGRHKRVAICDARLAESRVHVEALCGGGVTAIALEDDAVRQWRDGFGAVCLAAQEVIAIVRWHQAVVLSGLLREAGKRVAVESMGAGRRALMVVRAVDRV